MLKLTQKFVAFIAVLGVTGIAQATVVMIDNFKVADSGATIGGTSLSVPATGADNLGSLHIGETRQVNFGAQSAGSSFDYASVSINDAHNPNAMILETGVIPPETAGYNNLSWTDTYTWSGGHSVNLAPRGAAATINVGFVPYNGTSVKTNSLNAVSLKDSHGDVRFSYSSLPASSHAFTESFSSFFGFGTFDWHHVVAIGYNVMPDASSPVSTLYNLGSITATSNPVPELSSLASLVAGVAAFAVYSLKRRVHA